MAYQRCGHCKVVRPLAEFYPSSQGRCGTWCRPCVAAKRQGRAGPTVPHDALACEHCGREFVPHHVGQKHCSSECNGLVQRAKAALRRVAAKPERKCPECGMVLPPEKTMKAAYCSQKCASGAFRRKRTASGQRRVDSLWYTYGVTVEAYDERLRIQGGRCAICGGTDPIHNQGLFTVDHDHKSGGVRGLLCGNCNFGVGKFRNSPVVLDRAAEYLIRARRCG